MSIRVWGQGAEHAVLLHCSLAHAGAWDGLARALSDRLTLTAPDLVGHGKAPDYDPAQDFHSQTKADALAHFPDAPCHLVGHSFGATVALRIAIEHPARVRTLTLIEPVLFAAVGDSAARRANDETLAGLDPAFAADDLEAAARVFMAAWGDGAAFDALPEAQRRYIVPRMPLIAAGHKVLHQDAANLLPRLAQVACPVLLIEGGASAPVIGEIQARLERDLPDARRVIVDGAGHMVPITHAADTAQAMRGFVGG